MDRPAVFCKIGAFVQGIGRGAGNCASELLLGFLKNPKYNLYIILQFIERYMPALRESGVTWGYDLQYFCTGLLNQHPVRLFSSPTPTERIILNSISPYTKGINPLT